MIICQILVVLVVWLLGAAGLRQAFDGREAHEPYGFWGVLLTIVMTMALFFLFAGAGAFSKLF